MFAILAKGLFVSAVLAALILLLIAQSRRRRRARIQYEALMRERNEMFANDPLNVDHH